MKLIQNKYFILLILAITWGSSFILIKKSVETLSPYQVGSIRVGMAGLVLSFIGVPAMMKMDKKTIFWAFMASIFGNFFPMYLFPIAEVKVSSSLAGILNSLVPIFVLILSYIIFRNKSKWIQVFGAILGFIGAVLLMYLGDNSSGKSNMFYAVLIVLATLSYAVSGIIIKEKLNNVKSILLTSVIFTIWLIPSFLILLSTGFFDEFENTTEQWNALGYVSILSIFGTTMASFLFYNLIQQTSAVFATSVTYLMPIVALIWGFLAGERFSLWMILGGTLILSGIYLIREKPKL